MNVKAGDRARIVRTGTINDGAIVDVIELDNDWTAIEGRPIWVVRGKKLLGFTKRIPGCVEPGGVVPDCNLRRADERDVDKRGRVDLDEPESLADAVRKAAEKLCPTT
jgi:hypothetical protein